MREFKIYGEIGSNPDTPKFRAFVKNIETEINENEEIVNRSKKCNIEFSDKLKEILNNPENALYVGSSSSGHFRHSIAFSIVLLLLLQCMPSMRISFSFCSLSNSFSSSAFVI